MASDISPQNYGDAPAATAGRTSGLAIASLVLGIVGLFFPFWGVVGLIALILGIVALRQIPARGQRGRGMAITGVILGAVVIVWGVISGIIGVSLFMHH